MNGELKHPSEDKSAAEIVKGREVIHLAIRQQIAGIVMSAVFAGPACGQFIVGSVAFWLIAASFSRRKLTKGDLFFVEFGLGILLISIIGFDLLLFSLCGPVLSFEEQDLLHEPRQRRTSSSGVMHLP